MFGNSRLWTLADDLAPQPAGLEHVGLVDAGHPRARGAERDPGDPLDLLARVDAGVGRACPRCASSRRSRSRRSARGRRAGRCPRSPRASAGWRRTAPAAAAPAAGWRTGRAPCAGRAGPARGGAWTGRWCPTSGRRRRPAAPRRRARQAASVSSVSAVPWASIEAPPNRCSSYSKLGADGVEHLDRRADDLGPDAVAGQQDDGGGHGRRHASRSRRAAPGSQRQTPPPGHEAVAL